MTCQHMLVEWLDEGGIACFDVAPPTRRADLNGSFLSHSLNEDGLSWNTHLHFRQSPRLHIPTNICQEQIGTIPAPPVDGHYDLLLATRAVVPGHPIIYGVTFVETGLVGDAEPVHDLDEALSLVSQWGQGLNGVNLTDVHPALRMALARHMGRREVRESATTRSRTLLRECLNPQQIAEFDQSESFSVIHEGRTYRFEPRHAHNIRLLDPTSGEPTHSFCVVTSTFVPTFDQMLVQKLLLELDPTRFFELANQITLRAG